MYDYKVLIPAAVVVIVVVMVVLVVDADSSSRCSLRCTHCDTHTVVLQCCRRQAIPMEQAKIRSSVTLYSRDRLLPNLV